MGFSGKGAKRIPFTHPQDFATFADWKLKILELDDRPH